MPELDVDTLIVADVETLPDVIPYKVYYVDTGSDDSIPTQDGQVIPYVVVHPGIPKSVRTGRAGRGIINTRFDPVETYSIVEVSAPNPAIAKQIGEAINDYLMGRKYPGTSELILDRRVTGKEVKDNRKLPTTYKYALQYTYTCNL